MEEKIRPLQKTLSTKKGDPSGGNSAPPSSCVLPPSARSSESLSASNSAQQVAGDLSIAYGRKNSKGKGIFSSVCADVTNDSDEEATEVSAAAAENKSDKYRLQAPESQLEKTRGEEAEFTGFTFTSSKKSEEKRKKVRAKRPISKKETTMASAPAETATAGVITVEECEVTVSGERKKRACLIFENLNNGIPLAAKGPTELPSAVDNEHTQTSKSEPKVSGSAPNSTNSYTREEQTPASDPIDKCKAGLDPSPSHGSMPIPGSSHSDGKWEEFHKKLRKPEAPSSRPPLSPYIVSLRKNTLSYLVSNLPPQASPADLREIFVGYGKLEDVFIPKLKLNQRLYGFIRIVCDRDPYVLERGLSCTWMGAHKLVIKYVPPSAAASGMGETAAQKQHKATSTSKNTAVEECKTIRIETPSNHTDWLVHSVLANPSRGTTLYSLRTQLTELNLGSGSVTMVEGGEMLITYPSSDLQNRLCEEPEIINKLGLISARPWRHGRYDSSRLVWLQIRGTPLHGWYPSLFKQIADSLGEFVKLDKETESRSNLLYARILARITEKTLIDTHIKLVIGDEWFRVHVNEERYYARRGNQSATNPRSLSDFPELKRSAVFKRSQGAKQTAKVWQPKSDHQKSNTISVTSAETPLDDSLNSKDLAEKRAGEDTLKGISTLEDPKAMDAAPVTPESPPSQTITVPQNSELTAESATEPRLLQSDMGTSDIDRQNMDTMATEPSSYVPWPNVKKLIKQAEARGYSERVTRRDCRTM